MSKPGMYSFVLRHLTKLLLLLGKVQIAKGCIISCFSYAHTSPDKAIISVLPPPSRWHKMLSRTPDKAKGGQETEPAKATELPGDSSTVY